MKLPALMAMALAAAGMLASPGRAAQLNLATLSCDNYENQIVGSPDTARSPTDSVPKGPIRAADASPGLDAIDTVMWLFGFSVGTAGDHRMYGDALASFGFSLDAACKKSPRATLLQVLSSISPKRDQPMDLTALNCEAFESRHADSVKSDPDSAKTIMMWLFGFSAGLAGNHIFDPDGVTAFAAALQTRCAQNPNDSLYEVLSPVRAQR